MNVFLQKVILNLSFPPHTYFGDIIILFGKNFIYDRTILHFYPQFLIFLKILLTLFWEHAKMSIKFKKFTLKLLLRAVEGLAL